LTESFTQLYQKQYSAEFPKVDLREKFELKNVLNLNFASASEDRQQSGDESCARMSFGANSTTNRASWSNAKERLFWAGEVIVKLHS